MNRSAPRSWVLALALVALPAALSAQEPKDNQWTKAAQKPLTMAQLQAKASLYQEALTALQEGMTKDPSNAKVWLLAGQADLGLDRYEAADSAFDKAVQLYPGYADDIQSQREQAWLKAFQAGAAALDRQQKDSAIALMQKAEVIFDQRPEAALNLGMLYAGTGKTDLAIQAFTSAKQRLHGPLQAKLKPEDQAQWKQYEVAADLTLSEIYGNQGIEAFNAGKYDESAKAFQKAAEINANSRDYAYNYLQSIYAQISALEKQKAALAKGASSKDIDAQLAPLYVAVIPAAQKALTFDPAALDAYVIISKAYRGQAALTSDPKNKADLDKKSSEAINAASQLPYEVSDVSVALDQGKATLKGTMKTRTAQPGSPLKMKVSFLAPDGTVLGTADVNVAASTPDKELPFTATAPVTGQLAGWKYEIVK